MTDCPSVGVSQTVIVACVGYKGKEEAHFSLVFPFLSLHENSQRLRSDWLERKEMFHDLARQNWWIKSLRYTKQDMFCPYKYYFA